MYCVGSFYLSAPGVVRCSSFWRGFFGRIGFILPTSNVMLLAHRTCSTRKQAHVRVRSSYIPLNTAVTKARQGTLSLTCLWLVSFRNSLMSGRSHFVIRSLCPSLSSPLYPPLPLGEPSGAPRMR